MQWKPKHTRAFLSHTHPHALFMGQLATAFTSWGVHAFVAHEDIGGGQEWREEVLEALGTSHFLVAHLTDDFVQSSWTDQEVGFALGRRIPVVPVKADAAPHGFLSNWQGVKHPAGQKAHELAVAILDALERIDPKLGVGVLANALTVAGSFDVAWDVAKALERATYADAEILETVVRASKENGQVTGLTDYRKQSVTGAIKHLKALVEARK